jgi:hypothetical protein
MKAKREEGRSQGIEPVVSGLAKTIHILFDTKHML